MLSCGALERSNNPYIESIVERCISISQETDPRYVFLIGKKILKKGWGNRKKQQLCIFV